MLNTIKTWKIVNCQHSVLDYNSKSKYNIGEILISWSISWSAKLLDYSIGLKNYITELNYLFIGTLIWIRLLELVYWNIDWNQINLTDLIYSLFAYTSNIYYTDIEPCAYTSNIYHTKVITESCVHKKLCYSNY